MVCNLCGKKGARRRLVTRTYGKGEDLLVIQNIPATSCPNCGESYFSAETLREVECIRAHREHFGEKRSVQVADFV